MGQSSNAYIFYGYGWNHEGTNLYTLRHGVLGEWGLELPEELEGGEDTEEDWQDIIIAKRGLTIEPIWHQKYEDSREFQRQNGYADFEGKRAFENQWDLDHPEAVQARELHFWRFREIETEFGDPYLGSWGYEGNGGFSIGYQWVLNSAWGDLKAFDPDDLADPDHTPLVRLLEELEIDVEATGGVGPSWFLVSDYG